MRQLSAYVSRQVGGCKDGPCPNWYELADGDFMFQGEELSQVNGLEPTAQQAIIQVPRALISEGLDSVNTSQSAEKNWIELDTDHLALLGDRIEDANILDGIQVSSGEIFIRVNPSSITPALAEVV